MGILRWFWGLEGLEEFGDSGELVWMLELQKRGGMPGLGVFGWFWMVNSGLLSKLGGGRPWWWQARVLRHGGGWESPRVACRCQV